MEARTRLVINFDAEADGNLPSRLLSNFAAWLGMGKRRFTIDLGSEKMEVEGHQHRNVAVRYLMRRRRSILMTRDRDKAEKLFEAVPEFISIIVGHVTKVYNINCEQEGIKEFEGSRFVFALAEVENPLEIAH